jgi:hypothetical protein
MSTTVSAPLSLLHVDFPELYARHLCRHSQFGINVIHLLALFGVWYGVYGALYALFPWPWLPVALGAAYLFLVALNAPVRVCLATALFLGFFVATILWAPALPLWAYPVIIVVAYELQSLSHKVFRTATDMTAFNKKYPKGLVLFVVLLIYEVPLVLYFLFSRNEGNTRNDQLVAGTRSDA